VICSADDPEGRTSVLDLVAESYPQRLFTVGRLDYMTTGLLILTNDGDFANALSHPRSGVIKKYRVEAKEPVPRDMLEQWKEGVRVRGVKYQLSDFVFEGRKTVLLSLSEGKNREIRNVFASRSIKHSKPRTGPIWRTLPGEHQTRTLSGAFQGRDRCFASAGSKPGASPSSSGSVKKGREVIVTIDGPAGTGKSTIAALAAERSGLHYLNSGSVYRAITYGLLEIYGEDWEPLLILSRKT
jgi:pseudouridine synthase